MFLLAKSSRKFIIRGNTANDVILVKSLPDMVPKLVIEAWSHVGYTDNLAQVELLNFRAQEHWGPQEMPRRHNTSVQLPLDIQDAFGTFH